jgi:hypothetical protein
MSIATTRTRKGRRSNKNKSTTAAAGAAGTEPRGWRHKSAFASAAGAGAGAGASRVRGHLTTLALVGAGTSALGAAATETGQCEHRRGRNERQVAATEQDTTHKRRSTRIHSPMGLYTDPHNAHTQTHTLLHTHKHTL